MDNAKAHAMIAEKIWPDREAYIKKDQTPHRHPLWRPDVCAVDGENFNLLATNADGTPTTQADSDGSKVLKWYRDNMILRYRLCTLDMKKKELLMHIVSLIGDNKAIFNAAKEILDV